jgi:hypothetical protein
MREITAALQVKRGIGQSRGNIFNRTALTLVKRLCKPPQEAACKALVISFPSFSARSYVQSFSLRSLPSYLVLVASLIKECNYCSLGFSIVGFEVEFFLKIDKQIELPVVFRAFKKTQRTIGLFFIGTQKFDSFF